MDIKQCKRAEALHFAPVPLRPVLPQAANDAPPPRGLANYQQGQEPPRPVRLAVQVDWSCGTQICRREHEVIIPPHIPMREIRRLVDEAQMRINQMVTFRCPDCPKLR